MKRFEISELINRPELISDPDMSYYRAAKLRWDSFAKPLDGFGSFEDITCRCSAILRDTELNLKKRALIIMIADNGIVKEGVSQSGQDVTSAVAFAMGKSESTAGKLAASVGADVIPVDIGINRADPIPGLVQRKIAPGTADFLKEPAMTEEQVLEAIQTGMDIVWECSEKGYKLLGCGEMGIGNTTTSSACISAMLKKDAASVTGRGAGLGNAALERKIKVIRDSVERYDLYGADPFKVLSCVGGLDIAGLCGVITGGACYHIPVVLDGVITAAAALAAVRLFPKVREYLIASHSGREKAAGMVLEELGLEPVITADLALGEGSGALLLFALLDAVMPLYKEQTTFADMNIEQYTRAEDK